MAGKENLFSLIGEAVMSRLNNGGKKHASNVWQPPMPYPDEEAVKNRSWYGTPTDEPMTPWEMEQRKAVEAYERYASANPDSTANLYNLSERIPWKEGSIPNFYGPGSGQWFDKGVGVVDSKYGAMAGRADANLDSRGLEKEDSSWARGHNNRIRLDAEDAMRQIDAARLRQMQQQMPQMQPQMPQPQLPPWGGLPGNPGSPGYGQAPQQMPPHPPYTGTVPDYVQASIYGDRPRYGGR